MGKGHGTGLTNSQKWSVFFMGFYIEMISVGEGDSFLLTLDTPQGAEAHVLVDGGDGDKAYQIIQHIDEYAEGHVDLVIGSHLDDDHIACLIDVIERTRVDNLILNTPGTFSRWLAIREHLRSFENVYSIRKLAEGLRAANDLLEAARKKGVPVERALRGRSWACGDVTLTVLNPTAERLEAAWAEKILEDMDNLYKNNYLKMMVERALKAPPTTENNNASIIIELSYKETPYALFTGDAGAEVIKEVTDSKSYSFLKVPHHGSKTGLDEELVKQLRPKTAFIPVGDNPHGHPNLETLDLLRKHGATTFCSEKTKDCRRECKPKTHIVLHHRHDKSGRPGWEVVNPKDCKNNPQ